MSTADIRPYGYQRSEVKKDYEYRIFCGGSGAGGGVTQTGVVFFKFLIRNDQFSVRNRRLIIRNLSFQVWKQANFNGSFYEPVAGSEAPLKAWAFVDDLPYGTETDPMYMAGGIACPGVAPYDVIFEGRKAGAAPILGDLPQPSDPGYRQYTSIYLFWGNANYWWYGAPGSSTPLFDTLQVKKQDTDTRQ